MDGRAFRAGERGSLDNLERRGIANWEWHIRAQHDPPAADHIHEITQGPRVLNDRVVVERGQGQIGIAEIGFVELVVAAQAPDDLW